MISEQTIYNCYWERDLYNVFYRIISRLRVGNVFYEYAHSHGSSDIFWLFIEQINKWAPTKLMERKKERSSDTVSSKTATLGVLTDTTLESYNSNIFTTPKE